VTTFAYDHFFLLPCPYSRLASRSLGHGANLEYPAAKGGAAGFKTYKSSNNSVKQNRCESSIKRLAASGMPVNFKADKTAWNSVGDSGSLVNLRLASSTNGRGATLWRLCNILNFKHHSFHVTLTYACFIYVSIV
jgi:hypothetical protein